MTAKKYNSPLALIRKELRMKRWRAANPEKVEAQKVRARTRRFEARHMTHSKTESCEICGNPPMWGKALSWDHDHTTGLHRGWLCAPCNVAIGHFRDDPTLLRAAAAYLERCQKTTTAST